MLIKLNVFALLCATLSGCAFAPGPNLDSSRMQDDLDARTGTTAYRVQLINADLIAAQVKSGSTDTSSLPAVQRQTKEDYRVGPGDILGITVWGHPELTANSQATATAPSTTVGAGDTAPRDTGVEVDARGQRVAADGTIYFPTLGRIAVADMTTAQISRALIARLTKYSVNPQLDVRVTQFRSQQVQVAGELKNPGSLPITDIKLTVVDAITRSGGALADADLQRVQLTRAGKPYVLDIQRTLAQGDITQNVELKGGDILNVPDHNASRVFVLGEISKPQTLYMNKGRLTLADAVSNANSISLNSADPRQVFVIRRAPENTTQPVVYRLDMTQVDAILLSTEFELKPLDIVYVGTASVARFNRLLEQLLPTAESLYLIYSVGR